MKKIVIIGAGGHAKVIADIIIKSGDEVIGFLDDNVEIGTIIIKFKSLKIIGTSKDIKNFDDNTFFVIGIGSNDIRKKISAENNVKWYTAVHPNAIIGIDVIIEEGTVIMPGAIINVGTRIGKHSIINTSASIDHDNEIGNFVHVSPNATLAGTVKVCDLTHIGAGATVKNNISINKKSVIGAGAVVIKDINEEGTHIGIPTKFLERK